LRVELSTGGATQLVQRRGSCHRGAIQAPGAHGLIGVDEGDDARGQGDGVAAEAVGIAGAVPSLVLIVAVLRDARTLPTLKLYMVPCSCTCFSRKPS